MKSEGGDVMYNNPYYNNAQLSMDRIDSQIKELENMRTQLQRNMQPAINQTFQLAPGNNGINYVNGLEDVHKELVLNDTLFVDKTFSNMWLKTVKGEIKTYKLKEVKEKDDKDLLIEKLQKQIKEMKGDGENEQPSSTDATTENE